VERLSAVFPLLLLAILAALTFWLERVVQPPAVTRDAATRHDPDYIMENFVATQMGTDGLRLRQLEADRMVHYPDDDSTELQQPRLFSFENDKLDMSVRARHAFVSSEGKTVDFQDEVRAVRSASKTRSELVLTTDFLHVVPDDDYARTDRPVRIVDANTEITAVGLELNNKTKVVTLLSNVRGTYVQKK